VLSDRVFCQPPVQLLSPSIPVGDDVTHVTDENSVMREIEQAGLLGSFHHFHLKFVAGLQKLLLDALPDCAEPAKKYRKQYEDSIVRELRTCNVKAVEGLSKEVVEG
jgi:hypothetical protein